MRVSPEVSPHVDYMAKLYSSSRSDMCFPRYFVPRERPATPNTRGSVYFTDWTMTYGLDEDFTDCLKMQTR